MNATGPLRPMTVVSRILQILLACVGGLALVVDTVAYSWLRSGTFVLHVSDPDRLGRRVSTWTGTGLDSAIPAFLWLPSLLSWAVIVLWLIWQHGSTTNLWARGYRDLKIRPGWAVGWWFIPFANYAMPLVAMLELDRRSTRDGVPRRASPLLGWWWAAWLASSTLPAIGAVNAVFSAIAEQADRSRVANTFDFTAAAHSLAPWVLLAGVLQAIAAGLAIAVVRRVDDGQATLFGAGGAPPRPDAIVGVG
jgi:hypothetical protein